MSNIVLKLQKVTKVFGGKGDVPSVEIFKGMNFTNKRNEVVGLFSPSGSGKTTLSFFIQKVLTEICKRPAVGFSIDDIYKKLQN